MRSLSVSERCQVVMTAHDLPDPAPEVRIHLQQPLYLYGSILVRAVYSAAERVEPSAQILRQREQLVCQYVVSRRIMVAAAVIAQIVERSLLHEVVPLFGDRHTENDRLRHSCCVHRFYQRREAVGVLRKVEKMQM